MYTLHGFIKVYCIAGGVKDKLKKYHQISLRTFQPILLRQVYGTMSGAMQAKQHSWDSYAGIGAK